MSPTLGISTTRNKMHVTIKQLLECAQTLKYKGRLVINSSQVYTVQVCGLLTKLDHDECYSDYMIFDGTGTMEGRAW
ncbi:hypothetical protein C2845_PM07G33100 [Panicum miliaceum]|uniref:Uncharacterized protein n=1 Tax=Panicum miliaceum TaxID=4540 RepID=A0A3L6SL72_PANMI|nr:hypothetical protein C2845_PM07G33100 [Panicum miliaceum]